MANYRKKYESSTVISHRIDLPTNEMLASISEHLKLSKGELINRVLWHFLKQNSFKQEKMLGL